MKARRGWFALYMLCSCMHAYHRVTCLAAAKAASSAAAMRASAGRAPLTGPLTNSVRSASILDEKRGRREKEKKRGLVG